MSKRRRNKQGRQPIVQRGGLGVPKAAIPTARQGARSAVDTVTSMTQQTESANVGTSTPMQRDPAWAVVPFAPSQPIPPSAINRPRPDTGRPEPRLYEVPVGWNLPGSSHRHLPWFMLREAADRITLFRRCIEIRKNHMQGLDWGFRISAGAVAEAERASGGTPRAQLERQLHQDLGDEIARAKAWWAVPDKGQDYEFSEWLGLMLEEVYVLDALAIYPRLTYGGQLDSLEVLDGTTIKPLRDERGGRPRAPLPAYQQILWGFPRGEFQATVDDQGLVPGAMAADDLIYKRRVIRTHTPYGYSPVEQALDDGDLYLKRHQWMKAEYTVGAMPAGTFEVSPDSGLTPQQVAELERFYNDLLSGNTEERMKARFLPPGITPSERGDIAEKYKPEYDIHLLQLAISHFDTVLTELGFTESGGGLGSSGYHEGQEDVQKRKTLPIIKDIQGLVTRLSHRYLGTPAEIEFYFLGLDDEDEAAAEELQSARMKEGVITVNDRRDRLGLERYPFAEADMPMMVMTRGILFLEGASVGVPGGAAIEPGKALQEGGASPSISDQVEADEGDDTTEPPAKPAPGQTAKDAEAKAYRKWASKGRSRAFEWHHHTPAEVTALTKAGDVDPKAGARSWPGWAKDLMLVKHYSPLLSQGMTGAVQTRVLADAWLTARKSVDTTDASAWLSGQGIDFTVVLDDLMSMIYTEGYAVGDVSAASLASASPVDWGAWTPGDVAAAQQLIDEAGASGGLQNLLNSAGVTIKSINSNRLDDLAKILADGLDQGLSPSALDKEIAALLDDPQWASMVAQTETTRAVSAATLDRYRDLNVDASEWATAEDERVCPICGGNEDQGPIGLGSVFDSGDAGPPAHPSCRCALMPVVSSLADLTQ